MSIPDRLYNIAKGHLDRAVDRWGEIDAKAQQELDSFLAGRGGDTNNLSAWDRAVGKIGAASGEKELRSPADRMDDTPSGPEPSLDDLEASIAQKQQGASPSGASPAPLPASQTLLAAYKVLGVEPGSDYLTVRKAYRDLRERAAPDRFPEGSKEQEAALSIQRRIESAHMMLSNTLAPNSDRFDRLEL
jgi:hypothetical protein